MVLCPCACSNSSLAQLPCALQTVVSVRVHGDQLRKLVTICHLQVTGLRGQGYDDFLL